MMNVKFLELLKLQNKLNEETNGTDWTSGISINGRQINWYRCMYMEAAEAIDSLNWKHWKDVDGKEDIANLKVEVVDILHFLLSQLIVDHGIEVSNNIMKSTYLTYMSNKETHNFLEISQSQQIIDNLDNLIKITINKTIPIITFFRIVDLIDDFSIDDVRALYIGKNCLNKFRQDHGYKDGSYIKVWNGSEDNVYMQKIIKRNPDISFDSLYKKLTKIYSESI